MPHFDVDKLAVDTFDALAAVLGCDVLYLRISNSPAAQITVLRSNAAAGLVELADGAVHVGDDGREYLLCVPISDLLGVPQAGDIIVDGGDEYVVITQNGVAYTPLPTSNRVVRVVARKRGAV